MANIVFPPSPNWYLFNIMCVSPDGVIIYGSSSNDITILTPIINAENKQSHDLKIIHPAHKKRVTCLSLDPTWATTQNFVSGSEDGFVKLWNKTSVSFSICHNVHLESHEDVIGVAFLNEKEIVSVGSAANIVLWDIKQNSVVVDNKVLKIYKPLCISLCPLKANTIAIGTKQGVVLVLSVSDKFMMLFKAHGHETEITSLFWCPTPYCDPLEKIVMMKRHKVKTFRVRKFSNRKPENINKSGANTTDSGLYQQSSGEEADESDIFDVNKEAGLDECLELSDSDFDKEKKSDILKMNSENEKKDEDISNNLKNMNLTDDTKEDSFYIENNESFVSDCKKLLNFMNSKKALKSANVSFILDPDDSTFKESHSNLADESDTFDIYQESVVVSETKLTMKNDFLDECKELESILKGEVREDDAAPEKCEINNDKEENIESENDADQTKANESIFDIYEEPPFYEFGHSKYVPGCSDNELEETPKTTLPLDFLDECKRLKKEITYSKGEDKSSENESMSALSNEVNKVQINNSEDSPTRVEESSETQVESRDGNYFFLASACKNGKVCIWRWGGNLVSSGNLSASKDDKYKKLGLPWTVLFWHTSKLLLVASKSGQLLRCNFNSIYPRSKGFGFSVVHEEHVRGLYCIAANIAANINNQSDSLWRSRSVTPLVWSIGQDRLLIGYSIDDSKVVAKINTFSGFITNIARSPACKNRYAISAGDGMIRVWDFLPTCEENGGLGQMKVYWQNIQGKVQACEWHPVKENILAFGNAEGRVGLIDAKSQSAAKILPPCLSLGVNGLCWRPKSSYLYAHGAGTLVMYDTTQIRQEAIEISVTILERKWNITSITFSEEYFTVGSKEGGIALLKPEYPHQTVIYTYPHRKRVSCLSWHPLEVSTENGVSPYANMLAVSATNSIIVILTLVTGNDGVSLEIANQIAYHKERVNKLCWSPHHNGRLLSVSADNSALVYDVINKCPLHIIVGHGMSLLCCVWSPADCNLVMTAGEDFSLKVWNLEEHPYQEIKTGQNRNKKKIKLASVQITSDMLAMQSNDKHKKLKEKRKNLPVQINSNDTIVSESVLSLYWKQLKYHFESVEGCRRLFKYHLSKNKKAEVDYSGGYDYLRIYGTPNDINQLLNIEQQKFRETLLWNNWALIGLLRGDVKTVLDKAKEDNQLTPSLLCFAPFISNRFWSEMMSSYFQTLQQNKLDMVHLQIYQSIGLLASGNLEGGCNSLISKGFIVEALVAAKIYNIEHIANNCFEKLLDTYKIHNKLNRVAECYLVSGKLMDAAVCLGRSNNEEALALAAEIAKYAGNNILAENISAQNTAETN